MTCVSDRFVSLNKIIIAATVVYAGAVGFAHANEYTCVYSNICDHGIGHVTGTDGVTHDARVGDHITTPARSNGTVIEANSTYVLVRSDADPEHTFKFYPTVAIANGVSAQEKINTAITIARNDALQLAMHAMSGATSNGATNAQAVEEGAEEGISLEELLVAWSRQDKSEDWKTVPREYQQAVGYLRNAPLAIDKLAESRDTYWAQWQGRFSWPPKPVAAPVSHGGEVKVIVAPESASWTSIIALRHQIAENQKKLDALKNAPVSSPSASPNWQPANQQSPLRTASSAPSNSGLY